MLAECTGNVKLARVLFFVILEEFCVGTEFCGNIRALSLCKTVADKVPESLLIKHFLVSVDLIEVASALD